MEWHLVMRWECRQNCGAEKGQENSLVEKSQNSLTDQKENDVAFNYNKAQFTDDTGQAMVLLDSLKATGYEPNASDIAKRMLEWAEKENAFENNILGPTSKLALANFRDGVDASVITNKSFIQWKFYENCTNRLPLYTRSEKRTDRLCVRSFQGNTYK